MRFLVPLAVLAFFLIGFLLLRRGVRRFEERKRASGAWDENGPKNPAGPVPSNERLAPGIASQAQAGLGGGRPSSGG
jgi:hypothetical protein